MILYFAAGTAVVYACHKAYTLYNQISPKLLQLASDKLQKRNDEIENFKSKYPLDKVSSDKIQLLDACETTAELLALYESGKILVEEAMIYFCHAALRAHELTNCLTEIMFEEAINQAKLLDASYAQTGKLIGVMHGVPVSFKDTVSYSGKDSTVGVIKYSFKPKSSHAPIVQKLIDAGAIPFAKTNVPQTMLTFECRNPLWGRTRHPSVPEFSPGGSTGGDGALIALRGSFVGVGNDVGGSVRIPAHFSGICSLKPSVGRISFAGSTGYYPSSISIHPVNGPMARSADDLIRISSVLMGPNPYDLRSSKVPFNSEIVSEKKRLRFGIALTDGFIAPVPAVERALLEAKEALEAAGHEVVEFEYPANIVSLIALFYGLISADGGHHFLKTLQGEPIDPTLNLFFLALRVPPRLHRIMAGWLPSIASDIRLTSIVSQLGVKHASEIITMEGHRQLEQIAFDQHWNDSGIDALLCPVNAMPAMPYDTFTELNFTASYTVLWNLLDYVAGVIPVTRVDKSLDAFPEDHKMPSRSPFKADVLETILHKHYDPVAMDSLPVGIQVVGRPHHEEEVLHAMKAVESALKEHGKPFIPLNHI